MFLSVTFLLIACLSAMAEVSKTVTLETAGTLSTALGDEKNTITNLKVLGTINSTDVATMKDMAKNGALSVIDMSETTAATADLIGSNAFYKCSKLTSISLPYGITSIGDHAFTYCSSLTGITIPNSVKNIGKYAFHYCSSLTDITIPNSVTSIGECVFLYCTSLTSITIPNSVTSIGEGAFMSCSKLTSITIPNSVTNIDNGAFCECTSLASVTIPNSVTSIGDWMFNGCTSLTEVTLQGSTLPTCGENAFDGVPQANATLYCKAALLEKCQNTEPWKNFKNIVVKPFSITISDAGIVTGCFDDDLDFSGVTGVKAYIVSAFSPTESQVLLTRSTKIPAETGFIVIGSKGTYEIPAVATDYIYSNMLVGVLEETTVATTTTDGSYTNYVLVNNTTTADGVGFYLANGTTVSANKAYLRIPTSAVTTGESSDAKTSLRLSFDDVDDTTGITPVREKSDSASGKTVIYNLNGQRKQSLTKGLNIVNGKKIFVK